MELQELVDRIQRWKQRTSEDAAAPAPSPALDEEFASEGVDAAYAVDEMMDEEAPQSVAAGDLLDFDDMDEVTELNNDDSGIIDVTES
jgi:hypothetical protein